MAREEEAADAGMLQRVVEAIAISPKAAHELVDGYRISFSRRTGHSPDSLADKAVVAKKIINRYANYAAASGVITSLPGTVPGVGTLVSMLGGGVADVAAALKIQIDMCMCLVDLYEVALGEEDRKHMAFILALGGATEQLVTTVGKPMAEAAARRIVFQYLRGSALLTIKELFKKIGITFTQKSAAKLFPFGIGSGLSGAANFSTTKFVGQVAVKILAKEV